METFDELDPRWTNADDKTRHFRPDVQIQGADKRVQQRKKLVVDLAVIGFRVSMTYQSNQQAVKKRE